MHQDSERHHLLSARERSPAETALSLGEGGWDLSEEQLGQLL